jgi:hypothetical protein
VTLKVFVPFGYYGPHAGLGQLEDDYLSSSPHKLRLDDGHFAESCGGADTAKTKAFKNFVFGLGFPIWFPQEQSSGGTVVMHPVRAESAVIIELTSYRFEVAEAAAGVFGSSPISDQIGLVPSKQGVGVSMVLAAGCQLSTWEEVLQCLLSRQIRSGNRTGNTLLGVTLTASGVLHQLERLSSIADGESDRLEVSNPYRYLLV